MELRKRAQRAEQQHVGDKLSAYLDGELTPQERQAVEQHLAHCPTCRWDLHTLRQTVQWLAELPTLPVPRAFTLPVAARPVRAPQRSWGLPLLQGATVLVALLLLVVVAGDFLLTGFLPAAAPRSAVSYEQPLPAAPVPTFLVQATDRAEKQVVIETVEVKKDIATESPLPAPPMPSPTEGLQATAPAEETVPPALPSRDVAGKAAAPPSVTAEEITGVGGGQADETVAITETEAIAARLLASEPTVAEAKPGAAAMTETAEAQITVTESPMVVMETPVGETTVTQTETGQAPTGIVITSPYDVTGVGGEAPGGETTPQPQPKELPTEVAPTTVAQVQQHSPVTAPGREGQAEAGLSDSTTLWLGVAEIMLLVAFILLASATLFLMLRQRRAR